MIKSPIENYYITAKFYDVNGGVKTELYQKVILQVLVRKLHIDMLKIYAPGFSMEYEKNNLSVLVIMIFNSFFHNNYKI